MDGGREAAGLVGARAGEPLSPPSKTAWITRAAPDCLPGRPTTSKACWRRRSLSSRPRTQLPLTTPWIRALEASIKARASCAVRWVIEDSVLILTIERARLRATVRGSAAGLASLWGSNWAKMDDSSKGRGLFFSSDRATLLHRAGDKERGRVVEGLLCDDGSGGG